MLRRIVLWVSLVALLGGSAAAQGLSLAAGGATRQFSAAELLARPDAATITVPRDGSYGRDMTYRAVPLRALLATLPADKSDTIEARATDGFVSQIPRAVIGGASTPWVAIEDPAHPWPPMRGKTVSAGPFYLVWQDPARGGVSSEFWPYQLAALSAVASPAQRWPAIAVDAAQPAGAPARRGQAVFAANCLPCHRLNGNGEGVVGPDLLRPMAVTAYFTDAGLHALIRDPASVRAWPTMIMPHFDAAAVPDGDVDAVIAYLHYLAAKPR